MKKLSSIFYMLMGFGLSALAVIFMFLPVLADYKDNVQNATPFFFDTATYHGAWPSFIGYMLILLAGLALAFMALPSFQPSAKTEKIVLISSLIALVIGIALVALLKPLFICFNPNNIVNKVGSLNAGWYLTLIFAAGAAVMDFIALKLDW